jgi:hypothetical protein
MVICDICGTHGSGTYVSAEQIREAVFANGFNPFALGLSKNSPMYKMLGDEAYEFWKETIVAQDTSDWNICSRCMVKLQSYFKGAAKQTGVDQADVSMNPIIGKIAASLSEQKYKKKWWQFWK